MVTGARIPHPCLNWGSSYYPFEGTTFTLAAGRRIYNSGFEPVKISRTRTSSAGFSSVYSIAFTSAWPPAMKIQITSPLTIMSSATRDDDYWFIEPSLDVLITRWLSAGVYYLHREDNSNVDFFSFDDNQVGVRATVRF